MRELAKLPWARQGLRASDIEIGIEGDIAAGRLSAGDRLPSPTRISQDTGVSDRAVRIAYERLSAAGLLEARAQGGTVIAPSAVRVTAEVRQQAELLVAAGRSHALSPRTIEALLHSLVNHSNPPAKPNDDDDDYEPSDDFTTRELEA